MGWLDNLYDSIFNENGNSDYNEIEERHSYRGYEQTGRRITSGWASYDDLVGGPIKIVNNSRQSEIQCFRPGMVYSGAEHSEYTPEGTYAISAYWSGDILYAQLSNNRICEWRSPGCPTMR
jgi:hypothetical protein